jgi:Domain of unknown function (DUF6970)
MTINSVKMKYLFLILIADIFSCKKNVLQTTPLCIQQKIDIFKSEPKGNPPRSVIQFTYHDKQVFYFPPQCCDQYSSVLDDKCNLIGHPDGGFTGKGDGTPANFFEDAKDPKIIWQDNR